MRSLRQRQSYESDDRPREKGGGKKEKEGGGGQPIPRDSATACCGSYIVFLLFLAVVGLLLLLLSLPIAVPSVDDVVFVGEAGEGLLHLSRLLQKELIADDDGRRR